MKEYPYWRDAAAGSQQSTVDSRQVVERSRRRDVVIVGAGYTGLSAARALARAGGDVLVVEREDVGWGASSRNAGQVLTGMRVEPATLVARYGPLRARNLFDEHHPEWGAPAGRPELERAVFAEIKLRI